MLHRRNLAFGELIDLAQRCEPVDLIRKLYEDNSVAERAYDVGGR